MNETILFFSKEGGQVTDKMLLNTLYSIDANQCEVLFIHSALSFGQPNLQLKKAELLGAILDVIKALGVKNVCMPTFTFSFCNGVDYNPQTSASRMGVLNEFFRKQDGVVRSVDPLMSIALLGKDKDLVNDIGHSSCGANCTFDKLRHRNDVKFLFLGPKIGDCLTYMHYLEWLYSVDYRYERKFVGNVTINGVTRKEEYDLFVRYNGVIPNAASYEYEQRMYNKGLAQIVSFGDGTISIVDKDDATVQYKECLDEDPYFFVDFRNGALTKDRSFFLEKEMVAL